MAVKAIPEGFHSLTPYLGIKEAAQAIDFYKKAFNATEVMRLTTASVMPNCGSAAVRSCSARRAMRAPCVTRTNHPRWACTSMSKTWTVCLPRRLPPVARSSPRSRISFTAIAPDP